MSDGVSVKIMGINYTLSCSPEKKENLIKAAKLVHDTMTSVDEAGIVFGLDRVAVMAAINIANDVIMHLLMYLHIWSCSVSIS